MNRVEDLCTDLQLLISEHEQLQLAIAENKRLMETIYGIKADVINYCAESEEIPLKVVTDIINIRIKSIYAEECKNDIQTLHR